MTNNRCLNLGLLLLITSGLVWLGATLTRHVDWLLPYVAGAGAVLILIGAVIEIKASRSKKLLAP